MKIVYKIEISISPNLSNNIKKPYHWILLSNTGNNWCNECSGWAKTPNEAWNEAYDFYSIHKNSNANMNNLASPYDFLL